MPRRSVRCWHPVAYSGELAPGEPLAVDLLGEALVLWRDSAGTAHAFFDLCIHRGTALSLGTVEGDEIVCPYHGWRYGSDGACTRDPPARRPDPRAGQGARDDVHLRRALRDDLGRARGAALGAARGSRARGSRLGDRLLRAVLVGVRRIAPGRELHRLRPLPVRPPGPARRSGAARRPGPRGRDRRPRPPLRDRPARGSGERGVPGVRQRGRRGARAPQPLRAAPAVHDRAAPRLGRRGGDGLLLRLPAGRARPDDGLSRDRPQLQPRAARRACCRTSRT